MWLDVCLSYFTPPPCPLDEVRLVYDAPPSPERVRDYPVIGEQGTRSSHLFVGVRDDTLAPGSWFHTEPRAARHQALGMKTNAGRRAGVMEYVLAPRLLFVVDDAEPCAWTCDDVCRRLGAVPDALAIRAVRDAGAAYYVFNPHVLTFVRSFDCYSR